MIPMPLEGEQWSPAQRLELTNLLLSSVGDTVDTVFNPEQMAELNAILDEDELNPGQGRPLEEFVAEVTRKT